MIPGVTSTGSKRPAALFGDGGGGPERMVRAAGCAVWDEAGRRYVDTTMALGAVSLGYGHPVVSDAVRKAVDDGTVGPLPPVLEAEVADRLGAMIPIMESVRFLKTGAEAVAAAVRIARVHTGRDRIVTSGYQGWLDTFSDAAGVPAGVRGGREEVAFNDVAALQTAMSHEEPIAAVVVEPVVDGPPSEAWTAALNAARADSGALLVLDEIKTGLRLGPGGARHRYGFDADLVVMGKALGNGFPIAAVGGPEAVMEAVSRTWISSTLATEFVSLAAADAVLRVYDEEDVSKHIAAVGRRLREGLAGIASTHSSVIRAVKGIDAFCYLDCATETVSVRLGAGCAAQGVIFKRNAYNFMSLAHSDRAVDEVVQVVGEVVGNLAEEAAG